MSITYNQKIPHEGLMFAVDAANKRSYPGSGTKWYDISGHNYGGTPFTLNMGGYVSNPVWSNANGGGFYFNGQTSKSYFDAESTQRSDNHLNDTYDFTAIMWLKPELDVHGRYYTLDTRLDTPNYGIGMGFDHVSGTNVEPFHFFAPITGGYDEANDGTGDFSAAGDTFYMIGIRRIGDSMMILSPNGYTWRTPTFSGSNGGSGSVPATGIRIGSYRGAGASTTNYWYKGYIYNTMMWNRPLSDEETKQVFNSFRGRFGV
jgi:hypothetical protein